MTDARAAIAACVEWTGPRNQKGYGVATVGGRHRMAHRVAYEREVGPIPDGLTIDHLCRNRACVNVAHLEPVTNRENVLRGDTGPARNLAKTHCPKGHPLSGPNLIAHSRGDRGCRACRNEAKRVYREKHGERINATRRARYAERKAAR